MESEGELKKREAKRAALHECLESGIERATQLAQVSGKKPAEIQAEVRLLVRAEMAARKLFSPEEIDLAVDSICVGVAS